MTNFRKSISGILQLKLTSAEPEVVLGTINSAGIGMHSVQRCSDLSCTFCISQKDYTKVQELVRKAGGTVGIIGERGVPFFGRRLRERPILFWGILFFLYLSCLLPSRIFFVNVEGNETVSDRAILEAAEESGIYFGVSRRAVRSEKIKNAILSEIPQLQWAGVNTSGCVATISVQERTTPEERNSEKTVSSIIAVRDGFVLSGTAVQGNQVFSVGQTVKEGQILISGYTDCGNHIQATRAEGEIIAQTNRHIRAVTPSNYLLRGNLLSVKRKIDLVIRKKRINLWNDSGILDSSCGRMYEEYYITLPGGFRLPISFCVETYAAYDMQESELLQSEAEAPLSSFSQRYLTAQMIAGEIQSSSQTIREESGKYVLDGNYVCTEMIGREQQEQIGEANGKNS